MKAYKVREYHKRGIQKGNVRQEVFFDTLQEADSYYKSVFCYSNFSLNPTVWRFDEVTRCYIRIAGY